MITNLSDPNVFFLLVTVGLYGLIYECALPGGFLPGITGAICLLLGLFEIHTLPIDYFGVLLMMLGIGGMTAEAFLTARGTFALAGAIAFATGSKIFLTVAPGVSIFLIASLTLISVAVLSIGLKLVLRTRKRSVSTGTEALRGATGEVVSWEGAQGEVRAAGSVWKARSNASQSLKKGDKVKVHDIDGLCLIIEPVQS